MSAPRDLARLIARYRFLRGELDSDVWCRTTAGADAEAALEGVFLEIVRYQAKEPAISFRQIEFLLAVLADGPPDAELRRLISSETLAHVRRLADMAAPKMPTERVKPGSALVD